MNLPAIIIGLLLGVIIGAVFFLLRPGGSYRRLGLCLIVSCIGFAVGHYTAELISFNLWYIGANNISGALPGSLLALAGFQIFGLKEWK